MFVNEAVKLIRIPIVAATYNDEMNRVGRGEQMNASAGYDHAVHRGAWQDLIWFFLLDVIIVNSFILQLDGELDWKRFTSQVGWCWHLQNEHVKAFHRDSQSRRRFRTGDEFTPAEQHKYIPRG